MDAVLVQEISVHMLITSIVHCVPCCCGVAASAQPRIHIAYRRARACADQERGTAMRSFGLDGPEDLGEYSSNTPGSQGLREENTR